MSIPIDLRPSKVAIYDVVKVPEKGSKTKSPSLLEALMILSNKT